MKPRILLLATLLLLPAFAFFPSASALTWTSSQVGAFDPGPDPGRPDNTIDSTFAGLAIDAFTVSGKTYVFSFSTSSDNQRNLGVSFTSDAGTTWGGGSISNIAMEYYSAWVASSTLAMVCYVDAGDVFFQRSTNGGSLWTTATTVESVVTVGDSCFVTNFGTTYAVFYVDVTNTDLRVKLSTDGGQTWGAAVVVYTSQPAGTPDLLEFAKKNETSGLVMFEGPSEIEGCRTTDSGANWTCFDVGSETTGVGSSLDVTYVTGDRYDITFQVQSSEEIKWCSTSDGGLTAWVCNQVTTAIDGFTSTRIVVDATDTDLIGVLSTVELAAGGETKGWYYSSSSDGGAEWSTPEAVYELTDTSGSIAEFGAAILTNGRIAVFTQHCEDNDNNDVTEPIAPTLGQLDCQSSVNDAILLMMHSAQFTASGQIEATATATVTDLVGFDVDATGSIAIARTELGENVRIYNAQSLGSPVGGPVDTNCAVGTNDYEDAVMAKHMLSGNTAQLVGFLNCDASGDAQYMSIRQSNGDVPTAQQFQDLTGETCTPGDADAECPYDIPLTLFDEPGDSGLGQLGQVRDFPIDYSRNEENPLGADSRLIAWAFASQQCDDPPGPDYCDGTEPGYVGVSMYSMRSLVADDTNLDTVQHHPDQDVDDFCLGLDGASYYLASVVTGQPGHTWAVTFSVEEATQGYVLDSTISNSPSSFGSSGFGIACGGGQILHQDGNGDVQLLTRTGVFLDELDISGGDARGVTLSEEFVGPAGADDERGATCTTALENTDGCVQFGAYYDTVASEGVILNVTGGAITEVGRFAMPSGSFHSIRMDRSGQNVWVATSTTIARFAVTEVTTITPINIPGDSIGDPDPSDDGELVDTAALGGIFGGGAFEGALIMGSILFLAIGLLVLPKAPAAGAVVLVIGVVMLTWGLGWLPGEAVFAVTVLAFIGFLFFVFGGRGADA